MKGFTPLLCLSLALASVPSQADTTNLDALQQGYVAYEAADYAAALQRWRPLAEAGNAKAQYGLGLLHAHGQGIPQDPVQAETWLRKSAEQGHAGAQL